MIRNLETILFEELDESRGGATGWTGMDMSTPLFLNIDFLICLNSMKKGWGGGSFLASQGSISTRFASFTIQ